jgi:hypothetical protein
MKKIISLFLIVGVLAVGWYLFIRPFEFEVTFKAKTLPGDIIQTLRIWNRALDSAEVVQVDSLYTLKQNISREGRSYVYIWNFEMIDDSVTQVSVEITEPGRSIVNKLLVPVTDPPVEKHAREIVWKFYTILQSHLKITRVEVLGEAETASSFCVCRTIETAQTEKANGMMKDYGLLTSFISTFNLRPNGPPLVKVLEWNHNKGTLKFDFCFPVAEPDSLPANQFITFQKIKSQKVLKAVFHGNYITSDRAWYALINFANVNGYDVDGLPIEYFHNNPNLGIDEEQWKAEVYLPIK